MSPDERHRNSQRRGERKPKRRITAAVLEGRPRTGRDKAASFRRETKAHHATDERHPSAQARDIARQRDRSAIRFEPEGDQPLNGKLQCRQPARIGTVAPKQHRTERRRGHEPERDGEGSSKRPMARMVLFGMRGSALSWRGSSFEGLGGHERQRRSGGPRRRVRRHVWKSRRRTLALGCARRAALRSTLLREHDENPRHCAPQTTAGARLHPPRLLTFFTLKLNFRRLRRSSAALHGHRDANRVRRRRLVERRGIAQLELRAARANLLDEIVRVVTHALPTKLDLELRVGVRHARKREQGTKRKQTEPVVHFHTTRRSRSQDLPNHCCGYTGLPRLSLKSRD